MFSTKQLSEDQISAIRSWAVSGAQLPDIQLLLKDKFGIFATYMETRFVILDLGIELVEEAKDERVIETQNTPIPTGKVSVTLDQIAIPGSLVSGRVVFSDGESGLWMLDQSGRPSLDPDTPEYMPSENDIVEFKTQLGQLLEKRGI